MDDSTGLSGPWLSVMVGMGMGGAGVNRDIGRTGGHS